MPRVTVNILPKELESCKPQVVMHGQLLINVAMGVLPISQRTETEIITSPCSHDKSYSLQTFGSNGQ